MLIKCPECELQVSDKALSCPHCGYPLKPEALKPRKPRQNKRKRLPNGFGQITELKGRALRKPFRAMVTVGKTPEGRPICKLLKPEAYFETYNDAYAALLEYNKSPFDLSKDITVKELYERWSAIYYEKIASPRTYIGAWKYCTEVYDLPVRELKIRHIKGCMYEGTVTNRTGTHTASANTKSYIKSLFSLTLDYAVEQEIVDRNCARNFKFDEVLETENHHIDFTEDEMNTIWGAVGKIPNIEFLLIQCYTGLRPQEIGSILLENANMDDGYFIGGMKTKAGKMRVIPIHPKILEFVQYYYQDALAKNSEYLFNYLPESPNHRKNTTKLTYRRYAELFRQVIEQLDLNPEHKPHDGRVQFATMAKKYKVDEYAIKRIIGHKIDDITEEIYTKRNIDWLKEEISKIG